MDKQGLDERSTENNILQLMDQTYVTSSTDKKEHPAMDKQCLDERSKIKGLTENNILQLMD